MCLFCKQEFLDKRVIAELITCYAVNDHAPVTKGHRLVIPFEHKETYWDLTKEERNDIDSMCVILKDDAERKDPTITGWNIFWNCGDSAGQTVMHAHCHLVPRREGDVEDPTGGCRNVIPGKGAYVIED